MVSLPSVLSSGLIMNGRYLIIVGAIALSLVSCSKTEVAQSPSPTQPTPTPKAEVKPTFRSKAPSDRLVPKHQPILGTEQEQIDFKVRDAQAIFNNTPRPDSPVTLAVLAGNVPADIDVCNLPFIAVTEAMFERCAEAGMNYIQVANTFGFAGELTTEAGSSKTYTWRSGGGVVAITFVDDKLTSKTQSGLK